MELFEITFYFKTATNPAMILGLCNELLKQVDELDTKIAKFAPHEDHQSKQKPMDVKMSPHIASRMLNNCGAKHESYKAVAQNISNAKPVFLSSKSTELDVKSKKTDPASNFKY